MSDLPWFPFWASDFVSSRKVRTMTPEQVGVYTLLLCHQWTDGPLPDNDSDLSALANGADANTVRTVLERCFVSVANGWVNERLEGVKEEQEEKRLQKVRAGKASGKARRKGKSPNKKEQRSNSVRTEPERMLNESESESEDTTSEPKGSSEPTGSVMRSDELVAKWIDGLSERPPSRMISKQGEVARRICIESSRDQIERAINGIGKLFPHSGGEPWDIMDLERKFTKALEAGSGNGTSDDAYGEFGYDPALHGPRKNKTAKEDDYGPFGHNPALHGPRS